LAPFDPPALATLHAASNRVHAAGGEHFVN
jgi:hypothetical protein